jgi:hypothetical protein
LVDCLVAWLHGCLVGCLVGARFQMPSVKQSSELLCLAGLVRPAQMAADGQHWDGIWHFVTHLVLAWLLARLAVLLRVWSLA